ncbi:AraC family transcriptional regulator [Leeia sp. TBRC 13508]|uniref:AraC family transcriptional regulator n=1 Tax=Leeia speluncae TaxID=2884804 RepID=A0ABS8D8Y3_9NEIS|nr:AraC family transcriptional regulator [Leeia speluncae]MCB6184670.1 AraC family transcriptional regulator [Leeia speluncae]
MGFESVLNQTLIHSVSKRSVGKEDVATAVEDLFLFRREAPTDPCVCMVESSVVFVLQGAKQMILGDDAFMYNRQHFLITSLDLPASTQVIEASPSLPCLGFVFKLDFHLIAQLLAEGCPVSNEIGASQAGMDVGTVTTPLLDAFRRLFELLDDQASIPILAPLIKREIHYRLLLSDQSFRLRQMAAVGSHSQRIAKVIDWLKQNFMHPLQISELADSIQMSTSSLHFHFKRQTLMSPLQYQKWLRLTEARRLMLNDKIDAAAAAFKVGYESPSQFSREYSRLFGAPPKKDIETLYLRSSSGLPSAAFSPLAQ